MHTRRYVFEGAFLVIVQHPIYKIGLRTNNIFNIFLPRAKSLLNMTLGHQHTAASVFPLFVGCQSCLHRLNCDESLPFQVSLDSGEQKEVAGS